MEAPNLNYIKNLSGGDLEFEKKIIEIVQVEFPEERNTYENSISNLNFKETAEIVHKLKHKISILGLETGYETAVEFEKNLLNESLVLKHEFESILTNMTNFIAKL